MEIYWYHKGQSLLEVHVRLQTFQARASDVGSTAVTFLHYTTLRISPSSAFYNPIIFTRVMVFLSGFPSFRTIIIL